MTTTTEQTAEPRSPSLAETIARIIAEEGPEAVWWNVYRIRPDGKQELVYRVPGEEFDEYEISRRVGPGDYVRRLRTKGRAGHLRQEEFLVGRIDTPEGPASVPGAGAVRSSPVSHSTRDDELAELRGMVRTLVANQQQQRPASGLEGLGVVKEIAAVVTTLAPLFQKQATPITETLEALQMVQAIARKEGRGDGGGGGGFDIGQILQAIPEGLKALQSLQPKAPPQPPPQRVPAQVIAPVPQQPPPQPQPARPASDPLDGLVSILLIGSRSEDADPSAYATIVADALTANDVDVPGLIDATVPGELTDRLCAMRTDLQPTAAFLRLVEGEIRSLYEDTPSAETEPPEGDEAGDHEPGASHAED